MRHIHALAPEWVPGDDEFKFRERANVLVQKWHDIIKASKTSQGDVEAPPPVSKTNGESDALTSSTSGKKDGKSANGNALPNAKESPKIKTQTKAEQG